MAAASITLSSKPKMKDLNKYSELAKEWYFLGVQLEVDEAELDKIYDKYHDDRMQMIKMFAAWLEKGENPTYRKLIKALLDLNKRDIAASLCKDLGKLNRF